MEAAPIDSPFCWVEIDAPAKKRLIQLEQVLRAQVTRELIPFPTGEGEQSQFLLMLEDQADKWVERADEAYSQCLIEVGREKSNEVTHLVWTYGLSHFIREQVRDFLYLACGIDDTLRTVAAYSTQFPFLEDAMPSELQRVRRVDGVVERLREKWEKKVPAEMHVHPFPAKRRKYREGESQPRAGFTDPFLAANPKGRPRKDALADKAAKLKESGLSYAQVALRLNQEHPQETATKESVRRLLASRKAKSAHGAALPPDKKRK